jgi:hypothetical protein
VIEFTVKSTACTGNRCHTVLFAFLADIGTGTQALKPTSMLTVAAQMLRTPTTTPAITKKTNLPHAPVSQKSNGSALPDLIEMCRRSGEAHEIPCD